MTPLNEARLGLSFVALIVVLLLAFSLSGCATNLYQHEVVYTRTVTWLPVDPKGCGADSGPNVGACTVCMGDRCTVALPLDAGDNLFKEEWLHVFGWRHK